MRKREIRQYQMLVRVRDFGAAHLGRFPESTRAGQDFTTVGQAVKELAGYAVAQMSATRRTAAARAEARAELLNALEAIGRTARAITDSEAGFQNNFELDRRHGEALITAGRLFAEQAAPLAALFVTRGMPETFVADLLARVDRFEKALRNRDARRGENAAARARIEAAIASGFAATRQLDVIIANHPGDDPAVKATWEQDRKVPYRKPAKQPATPGEPAVSAPAPPAAPIPAGTESTPSPPEAASVFMRKVS